jgi:hypothetical protein
VTFDSEPGRDDGSLPPLDVVVPDDARELARDVLAYRREQRARRRRERLLKVLGPLGRVRHTAVFPLVATCVALALLAGTMLSVVTSSPRPETTMPPAIAPTTLPVSTVKLGNGQIVSTTALEGALLALIPPGCDCGTSLESLARQAKAAGVSVYFVYPADNNNFGMAATNAETDQYGDGVAQTVFDFGEVLFYAYLPGKLTALVVDHRGTVRTFRSSFDVTPALRELRVTH